VVVRRTMRLGRSTCHTNRKLVAEILGAAAQVGMVAAAVVDGRRAGQGRRADLSAWC
jgi:hypothetical protein